MEEKRHYKRLPLKLELKISSLFKQDYTMIPDINTNIQVKDISKSGIGFTCDHELPINYYFDAKIQLTNDKFFSAVIKIVRVTKENDTYTIGCEFVGLADILSKNIDFYETEFEEK